ncbi:hypothetical protein M378DRAFT_172816 [Amanita muscaria Koide BX008]|uniref:Rab-GAP TBC domain-containing protein n=1 Tax=Amanita muscaria (strain Koide BX008) TaxID=946122 RepID=A0A0C2SQJ3_AMAMK|nr:hypothetical protein M378DRAFT_172816 [Amanita muscaria Koide BX008]
MTSFRLLCSLLGRVHSFFWITSENTKLYCHFNELDVDLAAICFSWFLSLFTNCLPGETLFRVWDVFVVNGLDVLFRGAFGILRSNEQELLRYEFPALYVALENLPTRIWEADRRFLWCCLISLPARSRVP